MAKVSIENEQRSTLVGSVRYISPEMALTEAAQRHDRPSDDGFAAYAKMRVRGAMVDLLRGQSHKPRSAASWSRKRDCAEQGLRTELGRAPTAAEMAGAMDMPLDRYEAMRFAAATSPRCVFNSADDSWFRCTACARPRGAACRTGRSGSTHGRAGTSASPNWGVINSGESSPLHWRHCSGSRSRFGK